MKWYLLSLTSIPYLIYTYPHLIYLNLSLCSLLIFYKSVNSMRIGVFLVHGCIFNTFACCNQVSMNTRSNDCMNGIETLDPFLYL